MGKVYPGFFRAPSRLGDFLLGVQSPYAMLTVTFQRSDLVWSGCHLRVETRFLRARPALFCVAPLTSGGVFVCLFLCCQDKVLFSAHLASSMQHSRLTFWCWDYRHVPAYPATPQGLKEPRVVGCLLVCSLCKICRVTSRVNYSLPQ